jgi:uncharacterized protein (TIGR04255 family)
MEIKNPPLVLFRLEFQFSNKIQPTLQELTEFYQSISEQYPNPLRFSLIPLSQSDSFPLQIGPYRFISENKKKTLELFADSLIFVFNEYKSWDKEQPIIIDILGKFIKIFGIIKINRCILTFVDEFKFLSANFALSQYFTLTINNPSNWTIDYRDFVLGIKLSSEIDEKIIIRLIGIKPENNNEYQFRLEQLIINEKSIEANNLSLISEMLNNNHKKLIEIFSRSITEETKTIIGLR